MDVDEFLHAVAPELAALLRAAADYLERESDEEFDEPMPFQPGVVFVDERGQVVRT